MKENHCNSLKESICEVYRLNDITWNQWNYIFICIIFVWSILKSPLTALKSLRRLITPRESTLKEWRVTYKSYLQSQPLVTIPARGDLLPSYSNHEYVLWLVMLRISCRIFFFFFQETIDHDCCSKICALLRRILNVFHFNAWTQVFELHGFPCCIRVELKAFWVSRHFSNSLAARRRSEQCQAPSILLPWYNYIIS